MGRFEEQQAEGTEQKLLHARDGEDAVVYVQARRSRWSLFRSWFGSFTLGVALTSLVFGIGIAMSRQTLTPKARWTFAATNPTPDGKCDRSKDNDSCLTPALSPPRDDCVRIGPALFGATVRRDRLCVEYAPACKSPLISNRPNCSDETSPSPDGATYSCLTGSLAAWLPASQRHLAQFTPSPCSINSIAWPAFGSRTGCSWTASQPASSTWLESTLAVPRAIIYNIASTISVRQYTARVI